MGYSYDWQNRLCCDACGNSGGVRKRKCKYTVLGDSVRTPGGTRHKMHYCYPPALCHRCYIDRGGLRGIHNDTCKDGAAKAQAKYDAIEAALDAGELFVVSASTVKDDTVPKGMVQVQFCGRGWTNITHRLVPRDEYQPGAKPKLSDYPMAVEV